MSDDHAEAILELLRSLVIDVSGLRSDIAHSRVRALSLTDRNTLDRLLPAISDALGSATWSASGLFEHGETLDPKLHFDLCQILGTNPSRKALGKLLARGSGSIVNGLQIQRVARKHEGVIWRVERK